MTYSGIILAGGESSRMGENKAFISYHKQPQYQFVMQLMQPHCNEIVCSAQPAFQQLYGDVRIIPDADEFAGHGPISGLLSCMNALPGPWLLMAVDYPWFTGENLQQLLSCRNISAPATVCMNLSTGFTEPLIGIYESAAFPALISFFKKGNQSLSGFIREFNGSTVGYSDPLVLQHADSPKERDRAFQYFNRNE